MDIEANKGSFGTEKLSSRMFLLSMTFEKILDTSFVSCEAGILSFVRNFSANVKFHRLVTGNVNNMIHTAIT